MKTNTSDKALILFPQSTPGKILLFIFYFLLSFPSTYCLVAVYLFSQFRSAAALHPVLSLPLIILILTGLPLLCLGAIRYVLFKYNYLTVKSAPQTYFLALFGFTTVVHLILSISLYLYAT